jgi:hypothetical protein
VSRTPSYFLTVLIATYALAGRPFIASGSPEESLLPLLIEALHPDPESADMEKVYAKAAELFKVAGHLAARVRGGVVERGDGHRGGFSGGTLRRLVNMRLGGGRGFL